MEQLKKAMNQSAYARWGILILVGFILSVNYYFYDAFSTLKDLLTKEFGLSNTDYGLFVSFYSIPNTFLLMAVVGGIILDRWGIRRTGFMFVFFMAFGAFVTAYGLMYSIQNLGLWGVPLLAGIILDKTNPGNPDVLNYTPVIFMFAGLGILGLIFAVFLKVVDKSGNYGVEKAMNKK